MEKVKSQCYVLIVGNLNAHHTVWNCQESDLNKEKLLEKTEKKDICLEQRHNVKNG